MIAGPWWLVALSAAARALPSPPDFALAGQALEERPLTIPFEGVFDAPPAFHWRRRLPGPALNSATHAEHTRAVAVAEHVFVGSAAGSALYRLARRDGALQVEYPASASVEAEPLIADGRVYFADTGGTTWCYDLDGALIWSHEGRSPLLVRPIIEGEELFLTDVDGLAVALRADTGELVWRYQAKRDLTRAAELALYAAPPALVLDDTVVLGFSDGTLVGVDRASGEQSWARRVGEGRYPDLVAEPVAYGADILTSGYFKPLVAMDAASRNVRWRVDAGAAHGVVVDDRPDAPVVYHPGTDGKLRAISVLTGAERWTWDSKTSGALTAPVITDAGLIVGSSSAGLYLIDPERGKPIWRFHGERTLLGVSSRPTVAGRQLLFVSNSGWLYSMVVPATREDAAPTWPEAGRAAWR